VSLRESCEGRSARFNGAARSYWPDKIHGTEDYKHTICPDGPSSIFEIALSLNT